MSNEEEKKKHEPLTLPFNSKKLKIYMNLGAPPPLTILKKNETTLVAPFNSKK